MADLKNGSENAAPAGLPADSASVAPAGSASVGRAGSASVGRAGSTSAEDGAIVGMPDAADAATAGTRNATAAAPDAAIVGTPDATSDGLGATAGVSMPVATAGTTIAIVGRTGATTRVALETRSGRGTSALVLPDQLGATRTSTASRV